MAEGENTAFPTFFQNYRHNEDYDTTGFYQYIRAHHGEDTIQLLKQFSYFNETLARQKNRRIFLLRCKHMHLTPTFLNFKTEHLTLECKYLNRELTKSLKKCQQHILNLTISDTCKKIRVLDKNLTQLKNNINRTIPQNLYLNFINSQNHRHQSLFHKIKQKNIQKISNITTKKNSLQKSTNN